MRTLLWAVGILILVTVAIAALLPHFIESHYNRILRRPPYAASQTGIGLHRQLTIVDLHADSLLWGRNLLLRSNRGHVDVPRLSEGNVAVQIFTVVTKIPKGLNLNHNRDDTDQITKLAGIYQESSEPTVEFRWGTCGGTHDRTPSTQYRRHGD